MLRPSTSHEQVECLHNAKKYFSPEADLLAYVASVRSGPCMQIALQRGQVHGRIAYNGVPAETKPYIVVYCYEMTCTLYHMHLHLSLPAMFIFAHFVVTNYGVEQRDF
jgi:hypothetical protein